MKIFFVLLATISGNTTATVPLACPEFIATKQELTSPISGWKASSLDRKLQGYITGFSNGDPDRQMILAPFSSKPITSGGFISTWHFSQSEDIWVMCSYEQTTIQLSKPLPSGLRTCSIKSSGAKMKKIAWCQ
jgi:hypothetical protein